MDIVERLRICAKYDPDQAEGADEIERLRNVIKVQANAVRVLHEAETSELNHLRKNAQEAYTAKTTLDSEREANKILTEEVERLQEALFDMSGYISRADMHYLKPETLIALIALKEKE